MSAWWLVLLALGFNLSLWTSVGLMRWIDEQWSHARTRRQGQHADPRPPSDPGFGRVKMRDVAVLMAAHNEELVIGASLARLLELLPARSVHVVSDGSSDQTVALAASAGVCVIATPTNVGKAGALMFGLRHFELLHRFKAVMVLDADTELDPSYFDIALPLLNRPQVAAVAGCAQTRWQPNLGFVGNVVVCHRQRIYTMTQRMGKYGQTWRGLSATHIIPGFASIYRCVALKELQVDRPGLVIEDFNMTFELQNKRIGRVAFTPGAKAYTQDPATYRDYVKQTKRWSLGLWQTVRRTHPRRPLFRVALLATLAELVISSLFFLSLPAVAVLLALHSLIPAADEVWGIGAVVGFVAAHTSWHDLGLWVFLPDFLLSCAVALIERKARFLLYGLFFLPMKITDAAVTLTAVPAAMSTRSSGRWVSPPRRATTSASRATAT